MHRRIIITGGFVLIVASACYIIWQHGRGLVVSAEAVGGLQIETAVDRSMELSREVGTAPADLTAPYIPEERGNTAHQSQRITAALRSGKSADKESVFATQLPELLQHDVRAAARVAETLEPWAWREDVIKCVVRSWAGSNPVAAANWISRLPGALERKLALEHLCNEVAEREPEEAMRIAVRAGNGNPEGLLLEHLVSRWAAKDFEGAADWAARQPQDDVRNRANARLAMFRAGKAPAEAAVFVVERISPGPVQTEAAMAVLHQWILQDPAGAESWVELFPSGDLRRRADEELSAALSYRQSAATAGAPFP